MADTVCWQQSVCASKLSTTHYRFLSAISVPSVLWRCWLGSRKGIRPVINWAVGCWCGYLSGCEVPTCIRPSWCHCHSLSLASVKSRLVLPFSYRPTRIVPEKWPLNGCVYVYKLFISREPANSTAGKSGVFCLVWMCQLPSEGCASSIAFLHQNVLVLNWDAS